MPCLPRSGEDRGKDYSDPPVGWLFQERWKRDGLCPIHKRPLRKETVGGRTSAGVQNARPNVRAVRKIDFEHRPRPRPRCGLHFRGGGRLTRTRTNGWPGISAYAFNLVTLTAPSFGLGAQVGHLGSFFSQPPRQNPL